MPNIFQNLIGKGKFLEIEEEKITAFPKSKTLINVLIFIFFNNFLKKCPSFQKFQIEIFSHSFKGDIPIKTPFHLSSDLNYKVIFSDIWIKD